jgi:hypothetical protein
MVSSLLGGLDVKVLVAIIGLAGTLIATLIAYRQWRLGERLKREAAFVERQQTLYRELWEKVERAAVSLRRAGADSADEPEAIRLLKREKEFDAAIVDVNSFLLVNSLYIDRRDRDATRRYMDAVREYTSLLFRQGGPEALRRHANTQESILAMTPELLEEWKAREAEMEHSREAVLSRLRKTIRGS